MARERPSVLSSDEVEAFRKAFDRAPTPHALQRSLRFKSLIKMGAFAGSMIFLSYGEITPHDTQIVVSADHAQSEPTWLMLQRFPLALAPDAPWPDPDLTMPPLALLSLPLAITLNKPKPISQTATIRTGDNPSNGDLSRMAAANGQGTMTSGSAQSQASSGGSSGTSGATGSPKPSVKTAASNPLATLVSAITSSFNPSSIAQPNSGSTNQAQQSISGSNALSRAIDAARATNAGIGGSGFGSQSFSGLKKG